VSYSAPEKTRGPADTDVDFDTSKRGGKNPYARRRCYPEGKLARGGYRLKQKKTARASRVQGEKLADAEPGRERDQHEGSRGKSSLSNAHELAETQAQAGRSTLRWESSVVKTSNCGRSRLLERRSARGIRAKKDSSLVGRTIGRGGHQCVAFAGILLRVANKGDKKKRDAEQKGSREKGKNSSDLESGFLFVSGGITEG